jgi:peptidyl-prolyl cis-trans isomerase C
MQRMPADIRQRVGADPKMLQQLIDSIYLRRALAAQAERNGLLKDPQIIYKLSAVRENTLLEAELQRIMEAVAPAPEALEKQILSVYKAEPSASKPQRQRHQALRSQKQLAAETPASPTKAARQSRGATTRLARQTAPPFASLRPSAGSIAAPSSRLRDYILLSIK